MLPLFRLDALDPQEFRLLVGTAGDLDQIHAPVLQPARHLQAVLKGKAPLLEIGAVELHGHGKLRPHLCARRRHDLEQQPRTILEAAPVVVGAQIAAGAEELGQQVAVGRMNLHAGESRLLHRPRGDGETRHDIPNLVFRQRLGFSELPPGEPQRHRRWRLRVGIHFFLRLAPRVAELHPGLVAIAQRGGGPPRQGRAQSGVGFALNDDIPRSFQVVTVDLHVARDQQARATVGPEPVQSLQCRGWHAGYGRQPFGHRRLGKAVGNSDTTGQRQRFSEFGHGDFLIVGVTVSQADSPAGVLLCDCDNPLIERKP